MRESWASKERNLKAMDWKKQIKKQQRKSNKQWTEINEQRLESKEQQATSKKFCLDEKPRH